MIFKSPFIYRKNKQNDSPDPHGLKWDVAPRKHLINLFGHQRLTVKPHMSCYIFPSPQRRLHHCSSAWAKCLVKILSLFIMLILLLNIKYIPDHRTTCNHTFKFMLRVQANARGIVIGGWVGMPPWNKSQIFILDKFTYSKVFIICAFH